MYTYLLLKNIFTRKKIQLQLKYLLRVVLTTTLSILLCTFFFPLELYKVQNT